MRGSHKAEQTNYLHRKTEVSFDARRFYTPQCYGRLGDAGEIIEVDEAKFKRKANVEEL